MANKQWSKSVDLRSLDGDHLVSASNDVLSELRDRANAGQKKVKITVTVMPEVRRYTRCKECNHAEWQKREAPWKGKAPFCTIVGAFMCFSPRDPCPQDERPEAHSVEARRNQTVLMAYGEVK